MLLYESRTEISDKSVCGYSDYSGNIRSLQVQEEGGGRVLLHKIRELCAKQNITLKDLAEKADVPYTGLKEWKDSMPSADKLLRVAKVLGTTVEELLGG